MTSKLPRENNNYEEENPAEGWRKERRKVRKALKNSPAYIRGRLATPPKKKEPKGSGAKELEVQTKVEKVKQKKKEEQVTMKEGRAKCSRYFAFVKKILEVKKIKRAGQREESSEQGGVNDEAGQDPLAQVNISTLHCIGLSSSSLLSSSLRKNHNRIPFINIFRKQAFCQKKYAKQVC